MILANRVQRSADGTRPPVLDRLYTTALQRQAETYRASEARRLEAEVEGCTFQPNAREGTALPEAPATAGEARARALLRARDGALASAEAAAGDRIFRAQQRWLDARSARLQRMRDAKAATFMDGCTFQPNADKVRARQSSRTRSRRASIGGSRVTAAEAEAAGRSSQSQSQLQLDGDADLAGLASQDPYHFTGDHHDAGFAGVAESKDSSGGVAGFNPSVDDQPVAPSVLDRRGRALSGAPLLATAARGGPVQRRRCAAANGSEAGSTSSRRRRHSFGGVSSFAEPIPPVTPAATAALVSAAAATPSGAVALQAHMRRQQLGRELRNRKPAFATGERWTPTVTKPVDVRLGTRRQEAVSSADAKPSDASARLAGSGRVPSRSPLADPSSLLPAAFSSGIVSASAGMKALAPPVGLDSSPERLATAVNRFLASPGAPFVDPTSPRPVHDGLQQDQKPQRGAPAAAAAASVVSPRAAGSRTVRWGAESAPVERA